MESILLVPKFATTHQTETKHQIARGQLLHPMGLADLF